MSEDLMDFDLEEEEVLTEDTYTAHCSHCERDVVHACDTGEPIISESCDDPQCELLSCARSGGDPEPLDFSDSGC